jgi:hypothetical protein
MTPRILPYVPVCVPTLCPVQEDPGREDDDTQSQGVRRPVRDSRRPSSRRRRRLLRLPDWDEVPAPEPSSTGRYSVDQPHQSGMRSVSGGVHPVRPRSLARQAHPGDLATARPTRAGGAGAASGVEPDGRRHWRISSARSRSDGGIVSRSSWAVLTLMTRSNRTGCSTGSSPGLAPFRILYTKVAARRHSSGRFGP